MPSTHPTIVHSFIPKLSARIHCATLSHRRLMPFRCPDAATLEAYLHHRLDAFGMSSIKYHLLTCAGCAQTRDAIAEGHWPSHPPDQAAGEICERIPAAEPSRVPAAPLPKPPSIDYHREPSALGQPEDWPTLEVHMTGPDSPGLLAEGTRIYDEKGIFLHDIVFSTDDEGSSCDLRFRAADDAKKIAACECDYQSGLALQRLQAPQFTRTLLEPCLTAFAVQLDDEYGLANEVGQIVRKERNLPAAAHGDPTLVPCGAVVALVGHSEETAAAEGTICQHYLQGLFGAPHAGLSEAIIRDLLEFFRRKRAMRWFLGNFGPQRNFGTQFLAVRPEIISEAHTCSAMPS